MRVSLTDRAAMAEFAESTLELIGSANSKNYTDESISKIEDSINNKLALINKHYEDHGNNLQNLDNMINKLRNNRSKIKRSQIGSVLSIYNSILENRLEEQEKEFKSINDFQSIVNKFIKNKSLEVQAVFSARRRRNQALLDINGNYYNFNILSSGERHLITLLFCISPISRNQGLLLIDEPEISMHVAWQRRFSKTLAKYIENRQTIICTHSPEISADFREKLIKISARRSNATIF